MLIPTESKDGNADRAVPNYGDTTHQNLSLVDAIASEEPVLQPSDNLAQAPQQAALLEESIIQHFRWGERAGT